MSKTFQAAIIIQPPLDQWQQIQTIRKAHDKAYQRWMPHINMLYPFMDPSSFSSADSSRLRQALSQVPAFPISLSVLDQFDHGKRSSTLFVGPANASPVVKLQSLLESVFPTCTELRERSGTFHPHLTLGQFKGKEATIKKRKEFGVNWKPICWTVDRVYLIRRDGDVPFQVIEEFQLAGSAPVAATNSSAPQQARAATIPKEPRVTVSTSILRRGVGTSVNDCLERAIQWLENMNQQSSLPNTPEALARALAPLCFVYSNVESKGVLQQLLEDRFITKEGKKVEQYRITERVEKQSAQVYDAYDRNKSIPKNSYFSFYSSNREELPVPTSEEQLEMAYHRAVNWLRAQRVQKEAYPVSAFESQLEDLCRFKVYLDPPAVIEQISHRGLLEVTTDSDTVQYFL